MPKGPQRRSLLRICDLAPGLLEGQQSFLFPLNVGLPDGEPPLRVQRALCPPLGRKLLLCQKHLWLARLQKVLGVDRFIEPTGRGVPATRQRQV